METGRRIIKIEKRDPCPGWARLLGWLDGGLEGERAEIIGCHVPGCPDCRERLEFVEQVRRLRALTAYAYGPFQGAESAARNVYIDRRRRLVS